MRLGVVVALPRDFDDCHVGVGVGVVGAQGGDLFERVDCGFVLEGVEQGDAVVVPAHPLWILARLRSDGGVAPMLRVRVGSGDIKHGLRVVLAGGLVHRVVDEVLIEAAVFHGRGNGDGAGDGLGQAEAVANQLRAAGLDGVVVGLNAVVPDLMEIVEFAFYVNKAVGEGVCGGVEIAVGLDETRLGEDFAGAVLDGEVDPGLVEVALLWDVGMGDAFVLDDDVGDEGIVGRDGERNEAERRDGSRVR